MTKRTIALLLCACLLLGAGTFAEDVAGVYRPDKSTFEQNYSEYYGDVLPELMGPALGMTEFSYMRFEEDGTVLSCCEVPDLNLLLDRMMPILEGADANASIGWSESAGKLRLEISLYGESEFIDLDCSVSANSLTVTAEGVDFRFTRVSGLYGLAGRWQLDAESLLQAPMLIDLDDAEKDLLKLLNLCVDLNSNGTIGISVSVVYGTYDRGRIFLAEEYLNLMRQTSDVPFTVDCTYELNGNTLTITLVMNVNGVITTEKSVWIREGAGERERETPKKGGSLA